MSCGCNQSPCVCIPACSTDCPEIVDYSFENQNLAGVGVLDNVTGTVVGFRGVQSTNAALTVALNAAQNTIDLTFNTDDVQGTQTFENAPARALAVPDFDGQLGVQLDTNVTYVATGVAAGNWESLFLLSGKINDVSSATTIDITGTTFTFDGNLGSGSIFFNDFSSFSIANSAVVSDAASTWTIDGTVDLGGASILTLAGVLNFASGARIEDAGVTVPASSVLTTSATPGQLNSSLISTFLSSANTQTGWGTPSGTLTRTTYDTATVTTEELAQRVAALITDLKAILLPAT